MVPWKVTSVFLCMLFLSCFVVKVCFMCQCSAFFYRSRAHEHLGEQLRWTYFPLSLCLQQIYLQFQSKVPSLLFIQYKLKEEGETWWCACESPSVLSLQTTTWKVSLRVHQPTNQMNFSYCLGKKIQTFLHLQRCSCVDICCSLQASNFSEWIETRNFTAHRSAHAAALLS